MVWGRGKRPPPRLLNSRRIPIIEAGYGPESIGDNGGGIKCCHWPPKQEAVLRIHNGDLSVGGGDVDHGRQPGGLGDTQATGAGNLTTDAVVLSGRIRGPE